MASATFSSLGRLPLPNAYPPAEAPTDEPRFPLDVGFCPACSLVQLRHIVAPEQMFSEYLYFSSYSASMLRHAEALASSLVAERGLGPASLVVEVASNDGYLLQYFQRAGVPVLGIEPAANIAAVARDERHIPTISEFFGRDLAARLVAEGRRADVLLGLNVMAHVPDLNGVMSGIATMLAPGGVAVIEVPYVRDMVERTEFDTILSRASLLLLRARRRVARPPSRSRARAGRARSRFTAGLFVCSSARASATATRPSSCCARRSARADARGVCIVTSERLLNACGTISTPRSIGCAHRARRLAPMERRRREAFC